MSKPHAFLSPYEGAALNHLSFPIGGLGAGMFCLDGSGAFSHFSLRHHPDVYNNPLVFSAVSIKDDKGKKMARVLEGPVAPWKPFFPWDRLWSSSGMGGGHRGFGLPRFESARFESRFPFAKISLTDPRLPLEVSIVGWNPFIPGNADDSSLPVGALEYRFKNTGTSELEGVYSFHAHNFLAYSTGSIAWLQSKPGEAKNSVKSIPGGFQLHQEGTPETPSKEGSFAAWIDSPEAKSDVAWFRGGWFDPHTMLWNQIEKGEAVEKKAPTEGKPSPGGSVYLPFKLAPGEEKTVRLLVGWHVPYSTLRQPNESFVPPVPLPPVTDPKTAYYRPWYAEQFKDIGEVISYWTKNERRLHQETETFTSCFYDSTLPPEVIEAIAANLVILKSTTILRQFDGRVWAWEGTKDEEGSCYGTCTHVWNYAQAMPHLFPSLERTLRDVEFNFSQDEKGHQTFRATLPIGPALHDFYAAADGQLGGILKVYRDWRISGDTDWLRQLWPKVRQSLEYCIETWDPDHRGALVEPHHNTYDIEFWGADGMCTSFYLAALHAAIVMGETVGADVATFKKLLETGRTLMEKELFNGEYFIQKVQWTGLRSPDPVTMSAQGVHQDYSSEAIALLEKEGPKYQYGDGCISDGVLGEWMAWTAGLGAAVSPEKIEKHLLSVHRYNYRSDFSEFPNPQRPSYALGHEAGLILCSWPKGNKPSLPFVYSEEVWTGIEYQVASHLISFGHVEEGLQIVRACRQRYDGILRNPFDEIECGHWYARAMASYALLQALTGARYDAVDKTLYLEPKIKGDFRSFLATATGFGTVGIKDGKPFIEVKAGQIEVNRTEYKPA
jgi:uncharacterized protein (DUF608 family)